MNDSSDFADYDRQKQLRERSINSLSDTKNLLQADNLADSIGPNPSFNSAQILKRTLEKQGLHVPVPQKTAESPVPSRSHPPIERAKPSDNYSPPKDSGKKHVRISQEDPLMPETSYSEPPVTMLTSLNKDTIFRWQTELNKIKTLHESKSRHLEDQLKFIRQQWEDSEHQNTELRSMLRVQTQNDAVQKFDGEGPKQGMCIVCAQRESVITASHASLLTQKLDQYTKDANEMAETIKTLKHQLAMSQQREFDAFNQVKKGVSMVEQSQLEKTQALLEREQLNDELRRAQRRADDLLAEQRHKIEAERELAKMDARRQVEQLQMRNEHLMEAEAALAARCEKFIKEKQALQKELEKSRAQISEQQENVNKVCETYKIEIASAIFERDEAKQELSTVKMSSTQKERDLDQERVRLRTEVDELRRRLHTAEGDCANGKEEIISLTDTLGSIQKELLVTRRSKEESDAMSREVMNRSSRREKELQRKLDEKQRKFDMVLKDMESLLAAQNSLISKLKNESKFVVEQLQNLTIKYRSDVAELMRRNEELIKTAHKSKREVKKMVKENIDHGRVHQRMKEQLKKLAYASNSAQQQVYELMARQNFLLKDRNLLASEIEQIKLDSKLDLHLPSNILDTARQIDESILNERHQIS